MLEKWKYQKWQSSNFSGRFLVNSQLMQLSFATKYPLVHFLETAKVRYLISIQFSYTRQTKNTFFANFGYLNDRHFTANGYQNVIFCDKVELWNTLYNDSFFFMQCLSKVVLKLKQWKYRKWGGRIFSGSFIVKQTLAKETLRYVYCTH